LVKRKVLLSWDDLTCRGSYRATQRSTFQVKKPTLSYPFVRVDPAGAGVVSHAGGVLLVEAVRAAGLDRALSAGLARWRKPLAVHDSAKIVTDLAIALALGGDCLADIALLRAEPGVFGPVASDPTVSRTIDRLAEDAPRALAAIDAARAAARARVWELAGEHAPDAAACAAAPLVIDVDATLVTAHSDKESAARRSNAATGFIHCGHSSTTARPAPASRPRYYCDPGTREVTPPRTTSR
jgi:hypothetical protein